MVNQNPESDKLLFNYRSATDRRLRIIEDKLDILLQCLNQHLGVQRGAITPNMPHPALSAISRGAYTVTNGTTDRTYNADTVVVAELADIVYTLIEDLKAVKILG